MYTPHLCICSTQSSKTIANSYNCYYFKQFLIVYSTSICKRKILLNVTEVTLKSEITWIYRNIISLRTVKFTKPTYVFAISKLHLNG